VQAAPEDASLHGSTDLAELVKRYFAVAIAVGLLNCLLHDEAQLLVADAVRHHHFQHLEKLLLVYKTVIVDVKDLEDN
jgi:hypothetical protein